MNSLISVLVDHLTEQAGGKGGGGILLVDNVPADRSAEELNKSNALVFKAFLKSKAKLNSNSVTYIFKI